MLKRATTAIYSRLSRPTSLAIAIACGLSAASVAPQADAAQAASPAQNERQLQRWPVLAKALPADAALEQRLNGILSKMTLEQKIAQMIQPEIRDITIEDMRKYGFGSYLNVAALSRTITNTQPQLTGSSSLMICIKHR